MPSVIVDGKTYQSDDIPDNGVPYTRVVVDGFHEAERLAEAAAASGDASLTASATLSLIRELRRLLGDMMTDAMRR